MKNLNFLSTCKNMSEGWKNKGLEGVVRSVKSRTTRMYPLLATLLLLMTIGVGQMWAYTAHFSLMGDPMNNSWAKDTKYMINTGTGTTDEWFIYAYVAQNQYFALNNGSDQYGPGTNGSTIKNGSGGGQGSYNTNSWKFTGTSGIIKICCAESNSREWYPYVWVDETAPTIKFKHPWNGGSWTEQTATKQSDGTYRYKGQYGGTAGFNAGYSSNFKYNSSATTVTGSPASGDYCYFIWNPVGYVRGTQDYDNGNTQSEHCGTFTIVKLCGLTYDGNGRTGGTAVPSALSDQIYGTTVTLSSAAMTKTGYTLTGWNTANDGSGTHYDLGASFTFSNKSNTLYAEWTQTITIDANTGDNAGSMSIYFNAGSLKSFTAATKDDWILDSYWTSADESGSKVINYDATTGAASLVSNVTNYTSNTGKWTRAAATTLFAHWKQTYRVTYNANYPASATSTSGTVPTDATEYEKNATVTVKTNSGSLAAGGYTFAGWQTEPTGGTSYVAGSGTFSITEPTTLYAKWTENKRNVTISVSPSGAGTLNKTSASVGVATTTTVTATANPGYRFGSWSPTNCAVTSTSAASTTLKGNGTSGDGTLVANFNRSYAYIQGRMTIYNSARNSKTHVASSEGGWDVSSTRIQMNYDETNHRFYLHTYMKPSELSAEQSSNEQYFFFKTSTNSSSLTGTVTTYRPSEGRTLTAAGTENKKATETSTGTNSIWFNSSTTNGYAILYFDEAGVWYELEHRLLYDGNGNTGGSTPSSSGNYYDNGTNATAATNTYTMSNYSFAGWNTSQHISGTNYAAGASVPMTTNRTLYATWTRSVTLEQEDATTEGSTSFTGTYNCATLPSITNPSKTGYDFDGWYTEEAGDGSFVINTSGVLQASKYHWTDASGRFARYTGSEDKPLYAKWVQTVTLNYNSSYHGSGSNTSATVIYKKDALSSITHCTPATGYHLVGYYTAETGGTKILEANGSFAGTNVTDYITDSKWKKAGATTLYAHYEVNTYTIAFNANDDNYVGTATGSMGDQAVTWGIYPTLTSNGFTREGYTFAGWATTPTGDVAYSNGQTLTTNLTNENAATVTLYAKWTPKTYTVTFNARGGSELSATEKTVTMGATYETLATVTPPAGKVFSGWYTSASGGTLVDASTQVTTTHDHTLYAHYVEKAQVYFKNTLGWSEVWVTYDAYWDKDHTPSWGAGNSGKTYHKMTQIAGTDVYYDDIPDGILSSWKKCIAFNSQQLGSTPTGNYSNFDHGQAVFRRDFDSDATMFVPVPDDPNKFKLNDAYYGTWYYSTDQVVDKSGDNVTNYRYKNGYWVRYNNNIAGYDLKGSWGWSESHYIEKPYSSDSVYIYTIKGLSANTTYNFKLYKHCESGNTYSSEFSNTGTMTSGDCTNWTFNASSTTNNAKITTTVAGDYTFKFRFSAKGEVKLSVDYPFRANDYRVIYSWNDGSAHTYESEIIRNAAGTNETISVFVHKLESPVVSRSMKIQYCSNITNAGVATWTDVAEATIDLSDITKNGVYDFIITQPASGNPSGALWKKHDENYYIRTAVSEGGWDMYKYRADNVMTLSEYSMTQTMSPPFSHYYCKHIGSTSTDITYAIATDYSPNISGTMTGDATIGESTTTLPQETNVRFSWNMETNAMRRAYLKNAQGEGNARFLVLHGSDNKVLDANGNTIAAAGNLNANELLFSDLGNWIYQVELKAQPNAAVSLIAEYNSADRYLVGGASSHMTIMAGTGTDKYEILAVYDFKTNRLMTVWTPSGDITQTLTDVDVLLIRHAQEAGRSITFNGGSLTTNKVYGAIEFRYSELVGNVANWTSSSRPLLKFFVSFPFDVNVSDIFGLNSAYGDAYVIEKYDGAERAVKGFFRGDGTTTFWKELKPGDVMKANEGYCVIMDNDYMNNDIGNVWENKNSSSKVYLYFPSAGNVGSITSTEQTISIPNRECKIDKDFESSSAGRTVNHKNTDSHWNMMGVPVFANHTGTSTAGTPGAVFATSGTDGDGNFNYYYQWNSSNNQFAIHSAIGEAFKSMHSYMVQYYGDVTFTGAHPAAGVAARRATMAENYQLELQVLNSNKEELNRTYVELRENACDTFALNEDVYMSFNSNAVNIYTLSGNYDVAANVLSINNHTIPVCVEVTKAGSYTFSMPSHFSGIATLVDTFDGTRTNLALEDYEVSLQKGVIEDRFILELDVQQVATSIDGASGEGSLKDGKAHKFLQNNTLYILQNGVLYDARGARVQ